VAWGSQGAYHPPFHPRRAGASRGSGDPTLSRGLGAANLDASRTLRNLLASQETSKRFGQMLDGVDFGPRFSEIAAGLDADLSTEQAFDQLINRMDEFDVDQEPLPDAALAAFDRP
jgi:hypothetical protein